MTTAAPARTSHLTARLDTLREERAAAIAELAVTNGGDVADRATNVDANARLTLIEQRIVSVEAELANAGRAKPDTGGVTLGDVVTVDLGDGPETYLIASVDQGGDGLDVISPASPLGQAILGAAVGATVTYRTRTNRELSATVVAVS